MSEFIPDRSKQKVLKHAVLDADSIMYQLGWKLNAIGEVPNKDYSVGEIPQEVYAAVNSFTDNISSVLRVSVVHYHFTASAKNRIVFENHYGREMQPQFRTQLGGVYKGNRKVKKSPLPLAYHAVLRVFLEEYKRVSYLHDTFEADDAVVLMHRLNPDMVVSSNDKDVYNQIVGKCYAYDKRKRWFSTDVERANWFPYMQAIVGDPTDGFIGAKGIGIARVGKFLDPKMSAWEMWNGVLAAHRAVKSTASEALWNLRMAHMIQIHRDLSVQPPDLTVRPIVPHKGMQHIY